MGSLLKHDIKHFGTLRQIWDYLEDRGEHIGNNPKDMCTHWNIGVYAP